MADQVKLSVQLGRNSHLNVVISVADCNRLLALRRDEVCVVGAELGPAARAAGEELVMRRRYRGATVPGYRFGRVTVLESGPTAIVPTPSIDGSILLQVEGPAMEDW